MFKDRLKLTLSKIITELIYPILILITTIGIITILLLYAKPLIILLLSIFLLVLSLIVIILSVFFIHWLFVEPISEYIKDKKKEEN